jgi:hypothetical protein
MTIADLHPLYQQVGEILSGLRALGESIELRQAQTEKLHDFLREDVAHLRQDQRDSDEKLDCVICVMQHDLEKLKTDVAQNAGAITDTLRAVQDINKPVLEIMALRSRAAGLMVGLGVIGSALLWLADPIYRWLILDSVARR